MACSINNDVQMDITNLLQQTNDINDIYCDKQDIIFKQRIGDHINYNMLLEELHKLITDINFLIGENNRLKEVTLNDIVSNQIVLQIEKYQACLKKSIMHFIYITDHLYQMSEGIGKYSFFKYNADKKTLKQLELQRADIGNRLQNLAVPFMANARRMSNEQKDSVSKEENEKSADYTANEKVMNGGKQMIESYNSILNFYKLQFSEMLEDSGAQKELNNEMSYAIKVLEKSKRNLSDYFAIINGKKKHPNMSALDFPQRFIKGDLDTEKSMLLNTIIIDCFMVGYIYHFIFLRFPTRDKIDLVDFDRLCNSWLVKSLVADMILKGYSEDQDNGPEEFFRLYYENNKNYDKAFIDRFKIGYLKKSQVYYFMRNIMFSGALYGMSYDMATMGRYDIN